MYPASQTIKHGETATKPVNDPTKAGYEFLGWYNGDDVFDFSTPITAETTLTAKWKSVATITALTKEQIATVLTGSWAEGLNADNMIITLDNATTGDDGVITIPASGTLTPYKYTAFGKDVDKDQYFVVLAIEKPDSSITTSDIVVRAGIDTTAAAYKLKLADFTDKVDEKDYAVIVMLVGQAAEDSTQAKLAEKVDIYVNWDGMKEDTVSGTHYVINLKDTVTFGPAKSDTP